MQSTDSLAKLQENKLYLLPSGELVRINRVYDKHGKVLVYNYAVQTNQSIDLELAPRLLTPAFKVGEVAKMVGKSPDTLRKYESQGLLGPFPRHKLGAQEVRILTMRDILKVVRFFEERAPVGRPSKTNFAYGVNKQELRKRLKMRYTDLKSKI